MHCNIKHLKVAPSTARKSHASFTTSRGARLSFVSVDATVDFTHAHEHQQFCTLFFENMHKVIQIWGPDLQYPRKGSQLGVFSQQTVVYHYSAFKIRHFRKQKLFTIYN